MNAYGFDVRTMGVTQVFEHACTLREQGVLVTDGADVNGVSGTLTYRGMNGKPVITFNVARVFREPYDDRLTDHYEPTSFKLSE